MATKGSPGSEGLSAASHPPFSITLGKCMLQLRHFAPNLQNAMECAEAKPVLVCGDSPLHVSAFRAIGLPLQKHTHANFVVPLLLCC